MKTNKLPAFERMWIFTLCCIIGLLLYRCIFSASLHYTFLLLNMFVALTPYLISKQLTKCKDLNLKAILFLTAWLLLFPNSFCAFTDIFRFAPNDNIPFWYDLILLLFVGWNVLLPALVSLRKAEAFLTAHLPRFWVNSSVLICLLLSGYGVYLSRFVRYNSWNIIADSKKMFTVSIQNIRMPEQHMRVWIFVFAFTAFVEILYNVFKNLPLPTTLPKS